MVKFNYNLSYRVFACRNAMLRVILLLFMCLSTLFLVAAHPYETSQSIKIFTETNQAGIEETALWNTSSYLNAEGTPIISFYMKNGEIPVCRIYVDRTGMTADWILKGLNPALFSHSDFFIVPGINIPCDILPVQKIISSRETMVYDVRRTIGELVFVEKIQIEAATIDPAEAVNNGWLLQSWSNTSTLIMVTAKNIRSNELLVRQLWASDEAWWFYEETPVRKSWRLH